MDNPGDVDSDYSDQEPSSKDGRLVSRRQVLAALGAIGLGSASLPLVSCGSTKATTGAIAVAVATPTTPTAVSTPIADCVLASELTQGPYYLDVDKMRADITEGKPGVPLMLRITVLDVSDKTACKMLPNAAVEIWHCDASGHYSGFAATNPDGGPGGLGSGTPGGPGSGTPEPGSGVPSNGTPGPGGPGGPGSGTPPTTTKTDDQTFLRGTQLTNQQGIVEFTTIYPGWYAGRAIHIHTKAHVGGSVIDNAYQGGHTCHTGQFFFDDTVSGEVAKVAPYNERTTTRLPLREDNIYPKNNTAGAVLKLTQLVSGNVASGYLGEIVVGVDPNATPSSVGLIERIKS